jgi:tRNA pseudouridine55 synthase
MLRRLDGLLLLDKPLGMSSSAAVQRAKRLYRAQKAGHAGTLDPLASGLLLVLFGEATKFAQFGLDAAKEYLAEVRLGIETETGDAEGKVSARRRVEVDAARIAAALARFRGAIEQVPPMYSALKHGGQPLYALARAGREVERAARTVTVHELELLGHGGDLLRLRILCSKGTYVRQLAADLGAELGCGAHLSALRRTAVAGFRVEQAATPEALEACSEQAREARLLPADSLLGELPRLELDEAQAERFLMGQAIPSREPRGGGVCRVYTAGTLLGIGSLEGGLLQPRRSIARG